MKSNRSCKKAFNASGKKHLTCANVCIKWAQKEIFMREPTPTIKDIAQHAGVSYSTVSRAINNKNGVKPDVREKVLKIAEELNYFPHSSAKALVQKKVGVIGVIIPQTSEFAFQNPFYSHILLGVSNVANSNDCQLMLSINNHVDFASLYYRRQVDGIIVIANRIHDTNLVELHEKGIPVIAVPGFPTNSGVSLPSVNSENARSIYRAVNYLIGLGHKRIAFILGEMDSLYSLERLDAFQKAFTDKGLAYDRNLVKESNFSKTAGFRLMGELLDLPDPPTAVLCMNDSITPGALHQIHSRNLRVPKDISVLAIGCSNMYELFNPPLTTIKTPAIEMGRMAAGLLLQTIDGVPLAQKNLFLDSDLVIRESTGVAPTFGAGMSEVQEK